MAPDIEELIKKVNTLTLDKNRLRQKLTQLGNQANSGETSGIAGVECSTSCEVDLLFMNDLYRKRLDEYNENWDYIQSKCTALLSELNALQKHYSILKKEKLDLEEKHKIKCDECESIKSELQTVVLNYETQLSAMSEHLSMITSQVSLGDSLARVGQPH